MSGKSLQYTTALSHSSTKVVCHFKNLEITLYLLYLLIIILQSYIMSIYLYIIDIYIYNAFDQKFPFYSLKSLHCTVFINSFFPSSLYILVLFVCVLVCKCVYVSIYMCYERKRGREIERHLHLARTVYIRMDSVI